MRMATATRQVKAETAFGQVRKHAESIRNDGEHRIEVMDPGDMWAQGDIGLLMLPGVPPGAKRIDRPSAQLAPGTTQGSRHTLATLGGIALYTPADPTPLDGPLIEAPAGCRVEHPEHGDVELPPGVYAVVYQRAFADELRRVVD
jgi:hypothetical protein